MKVRLRERDCKIHEKRRLCQREGRKKKDEKISKSKYELNLD